MSTSTLKTRLGSLDDAAMESATRKVVGRLIFISSMSAHEGAESRYGRDKLAICVQ